MLLDRPCRPPYGTSTVDSVVFYACSGVSEPAMPSWTHLTEWDGKPDKMALNRTKNNRKTEHNSLVNRKVRVWIRQSATRRSVGPAYVLIRARRRRLGVPLSSLMKFGSVTRSVA